MTGSQAHVLLIEQGILATCAVLTLYSTARAAWKVKQGVETAQDFVEEAKNAL
jgi:hypothetical protein